MAVGTSGTATPYLYDRAAGLPVVVDDGATGYVHGPAGLLADVGGSTSWTLADGLGSVRARTNGAGGVVGTIDWDAFGNVRASTGTGGAFGWAGEQRDAETGLVHLRARQYAPGLGRFLSRDAATPNGPGTQGWQPYAYAGNNPTTLVDPSGHVPASSFAVIHQVVGGICGVALAVGAGGAPATGGLSLLGALLCAGFLTIALVLMLYTDADFRGIVESTTVEVGEDIEALIGAIESYLRAQRTSSQRDPSRDPVPEPVPAPVLPTPPVPVATPTGEESNCRTQARQWTEGSAAYGHIQGAHYPPFEDPQFGNERGYPLKSEDGWFKPELANQDFLDEAIMFVLHNPTEVRYQPEPGRADCFFSGSDPTWAGHIGFQSDWTTPTWTLAVAFESSSRRVFTAYPCDQLSSGEPNAGKCVNRSQR